jgi:hypothetical protein
MTYTYYKLDPVGFIEKWCVNKDKPELKCNGKCHLKKVSEKKSNDDQAPTKAIDFKDFNLFVVSQIKYDFVGISFKNIEISPYSNLYSYSSTYQLDHPPQI